MKQKLAALLTVAALALCALPMAVSAEGNVAEIVGDKEYATLQEAVDNAPDNTETTITLLTSFSESVTIPAEKNIVLDLNGKTLTNQDDQHTITNNGTLTVRGTGTVDNVIHQRAALVNYGTAVLNGGEFTRSKEAGSSADESGGNSWYTIFNQGSLTINDGAQVTQNGKFSSLIENGWFNSYPGGTATATLIVNGGTLNGGINAIKNDEGGIATINGGTITGDNSALMNWNIAEVNNGIFSSENGVAVINSRYSDNGAVGQLTIKGGTFTSGNSGANDVFGLGQGAVGTGSIRVEGGTFTGKPNSVGGNSVEILPSASFKAPDGTSLTPPATNIPVAKVGDEYFFTLAEALTKLTQNSILELRPGYPNVPIEVDAPLTINVEGATVKGGILQPSASFARNGRDGSVITVTADNVTLDGVTVDAGAVDEEAVKYAVQFFGVTGGKVNGGTIKNDGWAGILLNGSTATVTGTNFDLSGSCYAAIELGKGSGVTTNPNLTLASTVNFTNSNTNTADANRLIWVDLDPNDKNESIPAGMVTANNLTVKTSTGDMTYDANGLLVTKPAPQPEEPWTPTPTATPAPAPAAVLDSTPKTGAVSLAVLPLAGLALAGAGALLRKREE